jgi:hypothetical protein
MILMRDTTFSDVLKKKNVSKLWKLIVDTHAIMGSGSVGSSLGGIMKTWTVRSWQSKLMMEQKLLHRPSGNVSSPSQRYTIRDLQNFNQIRFSSSWNCLSQNHRRSILPNLKLGT